MQILDGKACAAALEKELMGQIDPARPPSITMVLVGANPASVTYVAMKEKACARVGIRSTILRMPVTISQTDLLKTIADLNRDPAVHGILVQFPLPSHINGQKIAEAVSPSKDVDGLHPINAGKLALGFTDGFIPCTPLGIQMLLNYYQIPTQGKEVVIIGRGNLVGRPLSALLSRKGNDATVTLLHTHSNHFKEHCLAADILVAAIGQAHFVKADMVKKGAVVIDVGINRLDGAMVGDVDFAAVSTVASALTPVPGGIGPMTIMALLTNTLRASH